MNECILDKLGRVLNSCTNGIQASIAKRYMVLVWDNKIDHNDYDEMNRFIHMSNDFTKKWDLIVVYRL